MLLWYAIQTRTLHEKKVAQALDRKGYELFLPVQRCCRRWSDRIKEIDQPLFPGYVFCRFDVQQRLPILVIPGVRYIVGTANGPIPVDEHEITALQSIVKSGLPTQPWPYLKVGQRVRLERGALEGVEGILLSFKKPFRLVVSIALLQRSVVVEIDQDWARPIANPAARAAGARCSL